MFFLVKNDLKCSTPVKGTRELDFSVESFYIFGYNVQSQTCSLYIHRIGSPEKPFHKMLLVFFGDADTMGDGLMTILNTAVS